MFEKGYSLKKFLDEVEKQQIAMALIQASDVKKVAAELLGINRTTLVEKMRKYGFPLKDYNRMKQ